jgi:hypothetical protein
MAELSVLLHKAKFILFILVYCVLCESVLDSIAAGIGAFTHDN